MAEDDETRFNEWEGIGTLSNAAFMLHGHAMVESVNSSNPGWISDEWLSAIAAPTTTTALELETLGMWEREGAGYQIHDSNMDDLIAFNDRMRVGKLECEERGHHQPNDDGSLCETCLKPLD